MIFLVKVIVFLKRLIAAFFVNLVFGPIRLILRFIFYKVVAKLYGFYLSLMKKLGWPGFKVNIFSFLFNQKLVHLVVAVAVAVLVFTNLIVDTRAQALNDANGEKTILASLIQSEFGGQEEDQLIEEFFDQEAVISPTQQKYLDNLGSVRSQPTAEMNPEEKLTEEEMIDITQDGIAVVRPGTSVGQIKRTRTDIVNYTIQSGDTVSTIAEKFEISVNTILWENNLSAYSLIRPGDNLVILPLTGVTYKVASGDSLAGIAAKYKVTVDDILEANRLSAETKLASAQKLIIPGGRKDSYAAYQPSRYSGLSVIKDLLKPSSARPAAGNKMNWPTVGYRITQYYSWRHFAIDIANKMGTPIYAADAGVIEVAGWGRGYGNQVVINHGGGKKTRYGHMSRIMASKGQEIDKGEVIGLMGSTGWSTGPHVHFEVIINGTKYNPLNYVK